MIVFSNTSQAFVTLMGTFKAKTDTSIDTGKCNKRKNLFQGSEASKTNQKIKREKEKHNKKGNLPKKNHSSFPKINK